MTPKAPLTSMKLNGLVGNTGKYAVIGFIFGILFIGVDSKFFKMFFILF